MQRLLLLKHRSAAHAFPSPACTQPPPHPSAASGGGSKPSLLHVLDSTRAYRVLIPARAIAPVLGRQPCLEALDLAQHVGDERARVGGGGAVRRDSDLGMPPERACSR